MSAKKSSYLPVFPLLLMVGLSHHKLGHGGPLQGESYRLRVPGSSLSLQGYQWKPQGEVRALVFISHGYAEWLGPYYSALVSAGAARGLLMFGHDHVGHGRSGGVRWVGTPGWQHLTVGTRAKVRDVEEYVAPVVAHCRAVAAQHPGRPLFMVGHSLGGLVAVLATLATQHHHLVRGLVLSSPLLQLHPDMVGWLDRLLARVFSWLLPSLTNGVPVNVEAVTTVQYWKTRIQEDKLFYHGGSRADFSQATIEATDGLQERGYSGLATPLLLLMTDQDQLVSPAGERQLFQEAASVDKSLLLFNEGKHHIFIEKPEISNTAIQKTVEWILNRI